MSRLHDIACAAGDYADRAISHPFALGAFVVFAVAGPRLLGIEATNYAISVLTAGILFVTAAANRQGRIKVETGVEELAVANPDVDESKLTE